MKLPIVLKVIISILLLASLVPILKDLLIFISFGWIFSFDAPVHSFLDGANQILQLGQIILPPVLIVVSLCLMWRYSFAWALLAIPAIIILIPFYTSYYQTQISHTYPTLMDAVIKGDSLGVQKFIDQKSNLDQPVDQYGYPPLFVAVQIYKYDIAELLINAGASTSPQLKPNSRSLIQELSSDGSQGAYLIEVVKEHQKSEGK
jgi:hypothetical protein